MRSAASEAKRRKLGGCLCACGLVKLGQVMIRKRRDRVRAKRGIRSEAEEIGRLPLRMRPRATIWRENSEAGWMEGRLHMEKRENRKQKDSVLAYIKRQYGVTPEHPWAKYPEYATFKAKENDKWFALIMRVSRRSLGLSGEEMLWVMNVKAAPDFIMMASSIPGYLPGYHMNKQHWLTILLNDAVPMDQIKNCIDVSYRMVTDSPSRRIYEAVKKIPRGKVATYGQIAEMAGDKKMARAVGNALHKNEDPEHVPCYRVVNSKGELAGEFAFGGAGAQAKLLRADGIEVTDGRVDLVRFGLTAEEVAKRK